MNALFAHDHRFLKGGDGWYSPGQFPYAAWDRYLRVFAKLTVIGRHSQLGERSPLTVNRSDGDRVTIRGLEDPKSSFASFFRRSRLRRTISELVESSDVVIARLPSSLGRMAALEAKRQQKPWAVEVVGSAWDATWNYGSLVGKAYAPFAEFFTRATVAESPFAMYVTDRYLQSKYPALNAVTAVASNVSIPGFCPETLKHRLERIDRVSSGLVIGFCGSLHGEHKGIRPLIRAFAQLSSSHQLRLLGPGPTDTWLELASSFGVQDRVHFDGVLPAGESVRAWMDSVDIYVQPSFQEGLPRALIEAMSRGCFCLGARTGGIPELLAPDEIHRPGDHIQLASQINRAISSQALRRNSALRNTDRARRFEEAHLRSVRHNFWTHFKEYASQRPS